MKRSALTMVPILLGAGAGAVLALMQARSSAPPARPAEAPRHKTVTAVPIVAGAATSTESVAPPPSAEALVPTPSASAAPTLAPASTSAPPAAAASGGSPALSLPSNADEQLQAEVRCNAQVAEACEVAARSVEQGLFGPKDAKRATMLRRIALTLYVKQCEGGRPSSCEQLAQMYERGDLKMPNPRTLDALAQRIRELCQKQPADPVCANPRR